MPEQQQPFHRCLAPKVWIAFSHEEAEFRPVPPFPLSARHCRIHTPDPTDSLLAVSEVWSNQRFLERQLFDQFDGLSAHFKETSKASFN